MIYPASALPPHVVARACGVDPGTTFHALAFLEAMSDGMIDVRALFYLPFAPTLHRNLFARLRPCLTPDGLAELPLGTVVLETITGELYGWRDKSGRQRWRPFANLGATKATERDIERAAEAAGVPLVHAPASLGRRMIVGHPQASDPQVKLAVEGIYTTRAPGDDLPPVSAGHISQAEARVHCLDAIVVGLAHLYALLAWPSQLLPAHLAKYVAQQLLIPGGLLTKEIRADVALRREKEQSATATRKMREKLGLPVEKKERRKPSRATAHAGQVQAQTTRFLKRLNRC